MFRRLAPVVVVSALVHLAVLWAWPVSDQLPTDSRSIEVEILAQVDPIPPKVDPIPVPVPELDPEPEVVPDPEPEPVVTREPVEEPKSAEEPQAPPGSDSLPRTVLNLDRPAIWDSLIESVATVEPRSGLEFNSDLAGRVRSRESDRGRQSFLSARVGAVYGLSDEQFGRTGARGDVVKIDGRCYSLEETPELGSEPRWWFTRCLDPQANPFEMKPLEVDARGRAIAD